MALTLIEKRYSLTCSLLLKAYGPSETETISPLITLSLSGLLTILIIFCIICCIIAIGMDMFNNYDEFK